MAKKKIRYVFGADVTELERGLKRVEYKLGKMSANAQRFGSAMTRNVTTPLVGLGALAVREAVKFESAFAKVKKSVGGTEAELKAMENGIVEMSKTMPTAAEEIAQHQRRREKRKPVGQRHVPRAIVREGRRAGRR